MTYYLEVEPIGYEPDRIIRRYEMPVKADSLYEAIMAGKNDRQVLMVTNVRYQAKPSRWRFPEDASHRVGFLEGKV